MTDHPERQGGADDAGRVILHPGPGAAEDALETILLGIQRAVPGARAALPPDPLPPEWTLMRAVETGPDGMRFPIGLKGLGGALPLSLSPGDRLLFLSHPWSGRVTIEGPGQTHQISLEARETRVLSVDPATGASAEIAAADAYHARFEPPEDRGIEPDLIPRTESRHALESGMLRIEATGLRHAQAEGSEVIVLRLEPRGLPIAADLRGAAERAGWTCPATIEAAGRDWPGAIKTERGTIDLAASESGRLTLLCHRWSGITEISLRDGVVRLDLFAPDPALLELDLAELAASTRWRDPSGALDAAAEASAPPASSADEAHSSEAAQGGAGSVILDEPVAIYVPRWRGVALSTQTLFRHALAVPERAQTHPNDITEQDIAHHAQRLLNTGARHFVISGGDLFNLKIIDAVQAERPEVRFDLLWHSNYLQMGEAHDWNLLRHWLQALRDGKVTRVGAVKEGLEEWFGAIGVDAVPVPNAVPPPIAPPMAPAMARETAHRARAHAAQHEAERSAEAQRAEAAEGSGAGPRIGLWLSGSSSYRKTPCATLLALGMIPGARLCAAGLDPQARAIIARMGLPFARIWPEVLPRSMLHREMARTDLTLYVTLSECAPMVPLESFALGVPCLIGPGCRLFADDPFLAERLIVRRPLSPAAIAEKAQQVLQEREEILEAFRHYQTRLDARARDSIARLVA
ncbi:MAG: hypothetical protein AAF675_10345 [Pseudomonadota bacterium]